MNRLLISFILLGALGTHAQVDVEYVQSLLSQGDFDLARKTIHVALEKNPRDVDAHMLLGNLAVYPEITTGGVILQSVTDENPYEDAIGYITDEDVSVVSEKASREATRHFDDALAIDPTREDIYLGKAYVLSISMRTDELIDWLPVLKEHTALDLPHYSMCDYGRNLIARGAFDDGMRVYQAVYKLFPNEHGLLSDMAGEYFTAGYPEKALAYIMQVMQFPENDIYTLSTAAFICGMMSEFELAAEYARLANAADPSYDCLLYGALESWVRNDEGWKNLAEAGLRSEPGTATHDGCAILLEGGDYVALRDKFASLSVADHYRLLLATKFNHSGNWFANYDCGEIYAYHKMYSQAWPALKQSYLSLDPVPVEDRERASMFFGWTLHAMNDRGSAEPVWKSLEGSETPYIRSCAKYFLARYLADGGDKRKARELCEEVVKNEETGKYSMLCEQLLSSLK